MPIVYRLQKGAPLTVEEVDNNFRELNQRVESLEKNQGSKQGGIGNIVLQGTDLIFFSPTKEILNQVQLPLPHFCPRGKWQPRQSYAVYDFVAYDSQAYCCIKAHQSSDQFSTDLAAWQVLLDLNQTPPLTRQKIIDSESGETRNKINQSIDG
jgi:hypothetical protein